MSYGQWQGAPNPMLPQGGMGPPGWPKPPQGNRSAAAAVGCLIAITFIIAALMMTGYVLWGRVASVSDSPPPRPAAAGAAPQIRPVAPSANNETADYFHNAASVPVKYGEKVGGSPRYLELVLYDTYAFAEVQDPRKHDNVDRYELRNGHVGDGDPVRLVGHEEHNLEASLFDLATVDFRAVPRMAADAVAQLGIDGGKLSHMILKRGLPFDKNVRWRVYVSGPRKSGSVEYDPAGRLTKIWK